MSETSTRLVRPERVSSCTSTMMKRTLEPQVRKTFLPTWMWSLIHYLYYCVLMILLIVFMIGTMAFDVFVNYTFGYLVMLVTPVCELYRKSRSVLSWMTGLPGVLLQLTLELAKLTISVAALSVHILASVALDVVKLSTNSIIHIHLVQKVISTFSHIFSLSSHVMSFLPGLPSASNCCWKIIAPVWRYLAQFTLIQRIISLTETDFNFSILALGTIPGHNLLLWICLLPARLVGLNIGMKPDSNERTSRSVHRQSDEAPVLATGSRVGRMQGGREAVGAHGWS